MLQAGDVTRFAGAVMLCSGALLLADVGLTLTWQEPLSSLRAARAQAGLRDELHSEQRAAAAQPAGLSLARRAAVARRRARAGHAIGRIELPSLHRSYVIVQGTATADLQKGPGHYPGTPFPGEGPRTVAVAGHRTTFLAPFRDIGDLRRGARIVLKMPYARIAYVVTGHVVVTPTQTSVLHDDGRARLALTTCDPPFSASHRLVVFARPLPTAA